MLRIGLISDTHGYLDPALKRYFEGCDEIWHAGDIGSIDLLDELKTWKPVRAVHGNIDDHLIRQECPEELHFQAGGVDVYMIHIGGRPGHYAKGIREKIKSKRPKLFICGHSHILLVKMDEEFQTLYMNPGASGKHGFHQVRTALRFYLDSGLIKGLELIELGSRAEPVHESAFSSSNDSK